MTKIQEYNKMESEWETCGDLSKKIYLLEEMLKIAKVAFRIKTQVRWCENELKKAWKKAHDLALAKQDEVQN